MSGFWIFFTVLVILRIELSTQDVMNDDDVLKQYTDPDSTEGHTDKPNKASNSTCTCVQYYLCDVDNGKVITDGKAIFDVRGSFCKDSEICCELLKDDPNKATDFNAINATEPSQNASTNSSIEATTQPSTESSTKPLTESATAKAPFLHTVCGKRNAAGVESRISGPDTATQFGEFPWMAAILKAKTDDNEPANVFLCGGSLIHPKVILTAGHCVFGKAPSAIKVRLGEWDTQNSDEAYPDKNIFVNKVIIHKKFVPGTLFNDIALLILEKEVIFAPNIDTICLSPNNFDMNGKRCFVSGWGKNAFGQNGTFQTIMKKIEVPVISNPKCQEDLRKTRLGPYFRLHESFICAGGEAGKDSCQGDGGSPLVCQIPNSPYYIQYGIVAWGIGCGGEGVPGVYANVPHFEFWIADQFTDAGLDTSYFKS